MWDIVLNSSSDTYIVICGSLKILNLKYINLKVMCAMWSRISIQGFLYLPWFQISIIPALLIIQNSHKTIPLDRLTFTVFLRWMILYLAFWVTLLLVMNIPLQNYSWGLMCNHSVSTTMLVIVCRWFIQKSVLIFYSLK